MPRGPNRKTVSDGAFLLQEGPRKQLGKIGGVNFSDLGIVEADILGDWDRYTSQLLAEQHSPDRDQLEKTVDALVSALENALIASKPFSRSGGSGLTQQEFSAAVNDLLREADLLPTYFKQTVADAIFEVDRLASIARVLRLKLAERSVNGEYNVPSGPALRAEFFRHLHQTLSRHGLDTDVGINSLIVELVLDLQGRASDSADPIERRRKDLAREIKLAVKPVKGGHSPFTAERSTAR